MHTTAISEEHMKEHLETFLSFLSIRIRGSREFLKYLSLIHYTIQIHYIILVNACYVPDSVCGPIDIAMNR